MKMIFYLFVSISLLSAMAFPQNATKAKEVRDKAADAAKDAIDEIEVPKAVVRGRVYYEQTGQPLRRTWIGFVKIREIVQDETNSKAEVNYWEYASAESVLTNDFGEFVMKDVVPGVYQAVLKLPGILNPTVNDQESTIFQQFTFESGSDSHIEVGVKRGGAVSGYVRYRDGAPLIGAEVSLLKTKQNAAGELETEVLDGLGTSYTDDRGYYRFFGLPTGNYIVSTSEPSVFDGSDSKVAAYSTTKYFSTSELKTYFPQAKSPLEAVPLQVYRGEELTDIDILLASRELYEVSGFVVGAKDNKLVGGIEIEFEKADETAEADYQAQLIRTTTTDGEGRWKFKDLLPGNYVAKISESSYRRYREFEETKPLDRPNYATSEHQFEVTAGENRDVIFRIAVEGSISGTVSVEGNQELPEGVTVYADMKNKRVSEDSVETFDYDSSEARPKVRGDFTVDNLAAGEYFLTVHASDGYFAKSIIYQGKNILDAPINIKEAQALSDIRVVLSSGTGTVEGKINGGSAEPYLFVTLIEARQDISLYRSYLRAYNEYTGGEDGFEIKIKPGEYYLFVRKEYEEAPEKTSTDEELEAWVRSQLKNAQRITVNRGQTLKVDLNSPE